MVLCVGAWAGQLLDAALVGGGNGGWGRLITPLRGHLLQISAAAAHSVPRLTHGLMETAYTAVRFLKFFGWGYGVRFCPGTQFIVITDVRMPCFDHAARNTFSRL